VPGTTKPGLLLFVASADHAHRDAACATLAWVAGQEGKLFECYYGAESSGGHYGGGDPGGVPVADLRGGTFTGGHHLEQLYLLLQLFECEAACLGPTLLDGALAESGVPVRSRSEDIATFYKEVFAASSAKWPARLLVVGDGGRPQGVPLGAYAFPEVFHRRVLAIAAGDPASLRGLDTGMEVEHLWDPAFGGETSDAPPEASVAAQTRWMAERWVGEGRGFMLGDPELVGRWTPAALREGWLPVFGLPQTDVIGQLGTRLAARDVVFGRQQNDLDFLELSRAGVAFQLIDPGRPPFPVVKAGPCRTHVPPPSPRGEGEPTDALLRAWADDGRVLSSPLFWTGMIRELENLYALADVFSLSKLAAGVILTSASFEYMPRPPLTLAYTPREQGGLAPRIEVLLASGGAGAFLESEVSPERFAAVLKRSVEQLGRLLGGAERVPRGWWGVMDAALEPRRPPSLTREPDAPYVRLRYRGTRTPGGGLGGTARSGAGRSLRRRIRESPLGAFFEPLRPFDGHRPGPPGRLVLEAVRDAGFEYAFTKSAFGTKPAVVGGVPGLTTLNYTVGRWDGWTPFATINSLGDLQQAERRLLSSRRPGWLVGTMDACLWAFTGPVWERGPRLRAICDWFAAGGGSGRLINVTPRTVARYARILADSGRTGELPAG
jgi:hypothetical protein